MGIVSNDDRFSKQTFPSISIPSIAQLFCTNCPILRSMAFSCAGRAAAYRMTRVTERTERTLRRLAIRRSRDSEFRTMISILVVAVSESLLTVELMARMEMPFLLENRNEIRKQIIAIIGFDLQVNRIRFVFEIIAPGDRNQTL